MDIEQLLIEIGELKESYYQRMKLNGGHFNFFEITNLATNELAICRVIYSLISPDGSHFQNDLYLQLFLHHVLKIRMEESELRTVKIYREYPIDENRRIDLLIQTNSRQIPIEVKIFADDQRDQCFDYYRYAISSNLYYLTRFGTSPSNYSADKLTLDMDGGYEEVTNISFDTEIINWLKACLECQETKEIISIKEIILQFLSVVKKMTNNVEDELGMNISASILSSSKHLEYALEIEKNLPYIKTKILKNVFDELQGIFQNTGKKVISYFENDVYDFYKSNRRTYPVITIGIGECDKDIFITLNIAVVENLHYYFALSEYKEEQEVFRHLETKAGYDEIKNEVIRKLEIISGANSRPKQSKFSFYWDYLLNSKSERYNFKDFSTSCVGLIDDKEKEIDLLKHRCINIFNQVKDFKIE